MVDAGRFLIILAIFIFGFSMHVAALNQPFHERNVTAIANKTITSGLPSGGKRERGYLHNEHFSVKPLEETLLYHLFFKTSLAQVLFY